MLQSNQQSNQETIRKIRAGMNSDQQEYFNRVFYKNENSSVVRGEMGLPSDFEETMLRSLRGKSNAAN